MRAARDDVQFQVDTAAVQGVAFAELEVEWGADHADGACAVSIAGVQNSAAGCVNFQAMLQDPILTSHVE